ncbi:MAG: PSD1 and planctomycete cytochrome C domain-containing protein [Verrucomicrobiota bacterium]
MSRYWLVFPAILLAAVQARAAAPTVNFTRDIRPILSDKCFACHGPDEKKRKADLRLDVKTEAFRDLGGYHAIVPGKPAQSELLKRITTKNEDDVMPPPKSGKSLKPEEVALFKRWIEQGAKWEEHWAFVPPEKPALPKVKDAKWPRSPMDQFILARLDKERLKPSPEADKETLIRRVTFDLTGLPPTPKEIDEFLADTTEGAYERVVDRLLKSPRYGEHMARYWLDAARYGDTHGLHLDNERSMWPYRDWVVRAFNDNLPFDQFTIWQLAGDLLPNATRDQQIASGFNRCNVTTSEGGSINEEFVFRYAVDRAETTAAVWMGLTAGCAVCHDHKFDPISQKDFYSMYAFFNSSADPPMDGNILLTPPILKLPTSEQEKQLAAYDADIAKVQKKLNEKIETIEYTDPSTLDPKPAVEPIDNVWVDDDFPKDSNVQVGTPEWVEGKDAKVHSGKRALKLSDKAVTQRYVEGLKAPLTLPFKAKIYVHVYLDPENPPKAVMLQFNKGTWSHRAVWGDIDAIDFGKKDSNERRRIGDLPKAGEWARLEFPIAKLGLSTDDAFSGLAFTQHGGTVYWDKAGAAGEKNPAADPVYAMAVWEKQNNGKAPKDYPKNIQDIFKNVKPEDRKPEHVKALKDYYVTEVCVTTKEQLAPIRGELKGIRDQRTALDNAIPATLIMRDLEKPREAFVMIRGQYTKPGERVYPNVPAAFAPLKKSEATNRIDLAEWLIDPKHPLTARVTVNRFWQQFLGTGIVKTANDFGSQGQPPSHPQLLDWLATNFIESGWDMKRFVKLIVTSATYRQSSKATAGLLRADPENRLLARGPRFRLDAEVLRDNALFVSGLMDLTIGGKGVKPYQPENIWEPVGFESSNTRNYKQDTGSALYRRSLYTFFKRTAPPPSMTTFDAPSREQFCVRRERSNTPLQALLLMNDVQHFEAARALAQRMLAEGGDTDDARLAWGFRIATARFPTKEEKAVLSETLYRQLARYQTNPAAAEKAVAYGESKPDVTRRPSELAAYTLVANLLLNLDETVSKN